MMSKVILSETLQFLNTLFGDDDNIATRPIESWTDPVKGRVTRTHYKRQYCTSLAKLRGGKIQDHIDYCTDNGVNVYFGVCPRFESGLNYEKSWQIRRTNCFWLDVDHCEPRQAVDLAVEAGLPMPTVCVSTGNGAHLYWVLDEPFIFDAPDPPALQREKRDEDGAWCEYWIDGHGDKNYTKVGKTKIWNGAPELCHDAKRVQYTNDGIARLIKAVLTEGSKIKPDDTGDLGRVLRLPGTLNAKDIRNKVEPKLCKIHGEIGERYSLSDFDVALTASQKKRDDEEVARQRIAKNTKSKLPPKKQSKLDEMLNECDAMPVELRSEPDFRVVCYCINEGLAKEAIWEQVEYCSKFAERGRSYFETTYRNAEIAIKRAAWEKARQAAMSRAETAGLFLCDDDDESDSAKPKYEEGSPQAYAAEYLGAVKLHCSDHTWYVWAGHSYEPLDDPKAQRESVTNWLIGAYPKVGATQKVAGDILNAARSLATKRVGAGACYWIGKPEVEWNLNDCLVTPTQLVNIETGETHPTSPTLFCATPIAIEYDPTATDRPNWDYLLNTSWEGDIECREALQDWYGYCLTPDTSQQKILLVLGPKRSGKGTFARTLKAVLGRENVTGMDAGTFTGAHGKQGLLGRSLAISGDARFSRKDAPVVVEGLLSISGEDEQIINPKFGAPFSTRLPTRMMFLSNELPDLPDAHGALPSRFVIIRQTVSFIGREDHKIEHKLKAELPAILNWAIEGWRRLKKRGHFVEPKSSASLREVWGASSSPVATFVAKFCVVEPDAFVIKRELYHRYRDYIYDRGHEHTPTETSFVRPLLSVAPSIITKDKKLTNEQRDTLNAAIEKENEGKHRNDHKSLITGRPNINVGIRLKTAEELAEEDEIEVEADEQCDFENYVFDLDNPLATVCELERQGRDTTILLQTIDASGVQVF